MFLDLTRKYGKPVCVGLYAAFAALAAKRKPLPLLILFAMHLAEYLAIGRRLGRELGLHPLEALCQCLSFGFTWWLPIKKETRKG